MFNFLVHRRPQQRPGPNKKPDNRKGSIAKGSAGNKNAKKGSTPQVAPGTSRKKPSTAGANGDASQAKDDDKEKEKEEEQEEEKKFEAANHMEGDLVDILGKLPFTRWLFYPDK